MSVIDQYRQEAKLLYPIELETRKINGIKQKHRVGEQFSAEEYEKGLKPVTFELKQMQSIIQELANKQSNSQADLLLPTDRDVKSQSIAMQEPAIMDRFLNDQFVHNVLSKHDIPPLSEALKLKNKKFYQTTLKSLARTSMELGREKARSDKLRREEIDKEIEVLKRYRLFLRASHGTGLVYYQNVKELIDRLELLMGQMRAGNDAADVQNEAITIIDKLLQEKKISKNVHEKLYEKVYSF